MRSKEYAIIVDESDNVIGYKDRRLLDTQDRFRTVVIWIENSQGQALIHLRSEHKSSRPGIWENAAGGLVQRGETYQQAAARELEEEIVVANVPLEFVGTWIVQTADGKERFCGWFKAVIDWPLERFKLAPHEVAGIKWIDKHTLLADRDAHPDKYMPSSQFWRELFLD